MLGAPRTGIVLITALLFSPAVVGFAVALQGFDSVLTRLRAETGGEYRQIIARVLLGAAILAYTFGLLAAIPTEPAIAPALLVGSLNLAAAWLFLLNVVLDSRRSGLRRYAALISDVILLSILLAVGGGLTAPLVLVYLYIAVSTAEHHGPRALLVAIVLELLAFAAVVMTTPFWRDRPLFTGGIFVAMVLLPTYVGAMLHRLGTAKSQAETANASKNRFLTALSEDLRSPLRAIARAGAGIDRATADPEQWDVIARVRLSARAMLLQLDDVTNYVKIDGGTFAPETRSFDLYRLANGAIAALRAPAAERGTILALRIDPQLPYQLRGWPHQLRQILICLITNAVRHSARSRVRINLDAVEVDAVQPHANRVTLRLAVTSSLADQRLETADEDTDRHLALAVVDRLVGLMGGRLAADIDPQRGLSLIAELPFAVDQASLALPLDLAHLPVLIVSKDPEFVGDLIEPLEAWRADPRWIGAGDEALGYLETFDAGVRRAVVIVDGRGDVLHALSWAHAAAELRATAEPCYVLFIADEPRIDSVIGLADGEFDGILPAPFTADALRSALHALRVEPADWFLAAPSSAVPDALFGVPGRNAEEATPRRRFEEAPLPRRSIAEDKPATPAPQPPPEREKEPLQFAALRPAAAPAKPVTPLAKRRHQILVAAGNAANRKILGSILARVGHIVHFAEDVDEARQGLETRDVDALLLDLTGYAGADYGAARLCRRARPALPIIALTSDSPELAEYRAREVGLDAILPKPVEPRRLVAALSAALEPESSDEPEDTVSGGVVTELASHPRFAGEAASVAAEAPRTGGQDGDGFQSIVDAFRVESARLVTDIDHAAGEGDVKAFEEAVQAMRACTEVFGVPRMRDLLASMSEPTSTKLRLQGADFVHRLESELARLDSVLVDYLKAAK